MKRKNKNKQQCIIIFQAKRIIKKPKKFTKMAQSGIIDMKTSQFPFGQIEQAEYSSKKILIKKRVYYKNQKQHTILQQKINILKNIYHKNAINFREVDDNHNGTMDVYYNYVPYSLQTFFDDCDHETIKEVHRQLIKLAIHLAKNCLLTSFNPNRCGIILNADNKWQVKYYLPLNEIVVTNDVVMLKRSVELFTVQSLHFLDSLTIFPESKDDSAQRISKNLDSEYQQPEEGLKKGRRQSQPYTKSVRKERRFSNQPSFLQFSRRKLSNMSRQKSQFSSDTFKHTNASTLFQTFRSSSPATQQVKECQSTIMKVIRPRSIQAVIQKAKRANSRSRKALKTFNEIIKSLKNLRTIRVTAKTLKA